MQIFKFNQVRSNRLNQRMMAQKKAGIYGNAAPTKQSNIPLPRMLYNQFTDFCKTQPVQHAERRYHSALQNQLENMNSI